jgi:hypothetical protein
MTEHKLSKNMFLEKNPFGGSVGHDVTKTLLH